MSSSPQLISQLVIASAPGSLENKVRTIDVSLVHALRTAQRHTPSSVSAKDSATPGPVPPIPRDDKPHQAYRCEDTYKRKSDYVSTASHFATPSTYI